MLYVAVWTGLRISELIGLKWRCIHADAITIEERYCRGDWSVPKTASSAATIGVSPEVITRMLRLKTLTVEIRAGLGTRQHKLVKADGPNDLVFQSVKDPQAASPAGGPKTRLTVRQLAVSQNLARDLVGSIGREPERCSGPDAALAHFNDVGAILVSKALA